MIDMKQVMPRFYISALTFIFLVMVCFGLLMTMNSQGAMTDGCPLLLGQQVICPLSFAQHIKTWRWTVSLPVVSLIQWLGLVFTVWLVVGVSSAVESLRFKYLFTTGWYRARSYLHSYLGLLFAQGILHKKIYA